MRYEEVTVIISNTSSDRNLCMWFLIVKYLGHGR